jgi:glycosyltransferase involved in cell wall biosynthesis
MVTKMKKILFIHTNLGCGGAEEVLLKTLENIDYTRFDVTLFLLDHCGEFMHRLPSNVHLMKEQYGPFRTDRVGGFAVKYGIRNFLLKMAAKWFFRNKHFDTIVSFIEGAPAKFHSFILNHADRNVSWVHCNLLKMHYTTWYFPNINQERRFYSNLSEIVFLSSDSKADFNKLFGLNKGTVIYNIVDLNVIRQRSLAEADVPAHKKLTFVTVGAVKSIKRHDRIIDAAVILKNTGYDVDFWILGKGAWDQKLRDYACEKNVDDSVHFWGFKPNPCPFVRAADAFIMSSDSEGFPMCVGEAMALGKAIISTKVSGVLEMLENGRYGILVDFSPESIADAVASLADDKQRLTYYQNLSLDRANSFFDKNKIVRQIHHALDQTV